MKTSIFKFVLASFVLVIVLFSCDDNSSVNPVSVYNDPCETVSPTPDSLKFHGTYDKPIVNSPNEELFYSEEVVEIQWELFNDLKNSELQIIELDAPYSCYDYEKFHLLDNNLSAGYGNQYVYYYSLGLLGPSLTDTIYVAYRVRASDIEYPKNYSLWTHVKTFTMAPLSNLKKETVLVSYDFDFVTEELNEDYYSGLLKKANYKIADIAFDNNLDPEKVRFVRPVKFETDFLTTASNGSVPFSRIRIGFEEDFEWNKEFSPFEVFGEVEPGSFEVSPVKGILYQTNSGNYLEEMKNYNLKVSYKLTDEVGSQHKIRITLTFEIYSDY
ncbi:hypothetical protein [uncultured Algibacter sp.]|uniref:hypothetical protein n=1 Tax=uncultured Algibacter sp. TaxID=298659 RepID=UPI0026372D14|nr:hypothetical protein [uncultured Algibacter sp.]